MKRNVVTETKNTLLHGFVLSCFLMLLAAYSAEAAVVGKFTFVEGTVDILKGGNLPAVPVKLNLPVEEKDVVRTKSNSKAEIVFFDKTVLRVAQRSRIDISEYSAQDPSKKGVIKLDRGKIEAVVEKKPVSRITLGAKENTFEIHTPNAVAGVRGTDFFMSYDKNVSITLVKNGNVCVFNLSRPEIEVCMPPSHITTVVGANPPEHPRPASQSQYDLFERELDTSKKETSDATSGPAGTDRSQSGAAGGTASSNATADPAAFPADPAASTGSSGASPPSGSAPEPAAPIADPAVPTGVAGGPAPSGLTADPAATPLDPVAAPAPSGSPLTIAFDPTILFAGPDPLLGIGAAGPGDGASAVPGATRSPTTITDAPLVVPITDAVPGTIEPNNPPTGYAGDATGMVFIDNLLNDGTSTSSFNGLDYLWNATGSAPAAVQLTGTFAPTTPGAPHLWYSDTFVSSNLIDLNKVTSDGGAYSGFISLQEAGGTISGNSYSLFLDPSGNTGVLRGTHTGTTSGTSFIADGTMVSAVFGTSAVAPIDFVPSNIVTDATPINGAGLFSGGGSLSGNGSLNSKNIAGQDTWGIASALIGGTYLLPTSNSWSMEFVASNGLGFILETDLLGSQWSGNILKATAAGFWTDSNRPTPATGIFIGETVGTYNPVNNWQAAVQGVWLETNKFLDMTATSSGRNALRDLNIPAVEVGRIDLSGALLIDGPVSGTDYVSVLMNNVIFFAPSTGQKPGIWATNNITGNYDFTNGSGLNATTIVTPVNVIALSDGDTIDADFQFTSWQAGKWTGKVNNGAGTLSGGSFTGPINFRGGAAGTVTGTTSGALTGTAAGTVK